MTPPAPTPPAHARGALAAALAFLSWGLLPVYWRALQRVDPFELIAHRILWSLLLLVPVGLAQGTWASVCAARRERGLLGRHLGSGALLAVNWTVYVWAVNTGHIVESALGYFLTPLLTVAIGVLGLHERLRRGQAVALGLAAAGVALQVVRLGQVPVIALVLAGSWASYALLRKQSPLGSVGGLTLETLLLAIPALALLGWRWHAGTIAFTQVDGLSHALIVGTGIVTAVPLLLFAFGARLIRFTTIGVLQYIAPSVQFILGVAVYREAFPPDRWLAFGLIWAALAVYALDSVRAARAGEAGRR